MFHGEKPGETKLAPHWSLERVAKHAIDFWLSTEDLPRPENRVSVDRDGKLTLAYTATNDVPKQQLYAQLKSILGKLRMEPDHLFGRFPGVERLQVVLEPSTVRFLRGEASLDGVVFLEAAVLGIDAEHLSGTELPAADTAMSTDIDGASF